MTACSKANPVSYISNQASLSKSLILRFAPVSFEIFLPTLVSAKVLLIPVPFVLVLKTPLAIKPKPLSISLTKFLPSAAVISLTACGESVNPALCNKIIGSEILEIVAKGK